MIPMNARRAFAMVALIAVAASGCARSWDTDEINNPATSVAVRYSRDLDGVVASITDLLSTPGPDQNHWSPTRDEAACTADRLVARFSAEGLLDRGFDPNQATLALSYSPEDRVAAINVLVGCIDFSEGVLALMSSYQKVPKADAICFAAGMERLGLTRDLAGSLVDAAQPDPYANSNRFGLGIGEIAGECLSDEALITALDPAGVPAAPPGAPSPSTSAATDTTTPGTGDDLIGIVPGGPLDLGESETEEGGVPPR